MQNKNNLIMKTITKNTSLMVIAFMALLVNISCAKEVVVPATLTASPTSASIVKEGGNSQITVITTAAWTATSSAAWCTVSPASGTGNGSIAITAAANTAAGRVATVTIIGTGVAAPTTVNITQAGETVSTNPFVGVWKDEAFATPNTFQQYTFNGDLTVQDFFFDGGTGQSVTNTGTFSFNETANQLTLVLTGEPVDNVGYNFINATTLEIDGFTYFKQ
ncbi:MAG: hypothetical protein ACI8ZX_000219 [Planctomycetota bacterium]|jgi:hypothetical protein